jgi:hypothetical protein
MDGAIQEQKNEFCLHDWTSDPKAVIIHHHHVAHYYVRLEMIER